MNLRSSVRRTAFPRNDPITAGGYPKSGSRQFQTRPNDAGGETRTSARTRAKARFTATPSRHEAWGLIAALPATELNSVGMEARPDPNANASQATGEEQVACAWCGLFSPPGPACEVCGSPLPAPGVASWTQAALGVLEAAPNGQAIPLREAGDNYRMPAPPSRSAETPSVALPSGDAPPTAPTQLTSIPNPSSIPPGPQTEAGAAALVAHAEALLRQAKSLFEETASLVKEKSAPTDQTAAMPSASVAPS